MISVPFLYIVFIFNISVPFKVKQILSNTVTSLFKQCVLLYLFDLIYLRVQQVERNRFVSVCILVA